jgi:hypothetical protein
VVVVVVLQHVWKFSEVFGTMQTLHNKNKLLMYCRQAQQTFNNILNKCCMLSYICFKSCILVADGGP